MDAALNKKIEEQNKKQLKTKKFQDIARKDLKKTDVSMYLCK